ncbi:MAG: T9SS type A sorting domain-containing protein, partial [Rhodothermales bacterium]|nr:T9SS type A sorting domain-containing protein [Rhodothermales bacterium]
SIGRLPAEEAWSGSYWDGLNLRIEAVPDPGYRFTSWSGGATSSDRVLQLDPAGGLQLTANFEVDASGQSALVITEIQYNPAGPEGEWVEVHNAGAQDVDLTGWVLGDGTATLALPSLSLAAGGHAVLCQDRAGFETVFGSSCTGDWTFSLSNGGDLVQLVTPTGIVADSVRYSDASPWPSEPDGAGYSLALVDHRSDNALASSWRPSRYPGGSPGGPNVVLTNTEASAVPMALEVQIYPNPVGPSGELSALVSMPQGGKLGLEVFDVLGRRVFETGLTVVPAGLHPVTGIRLGSAAGVYLVRLTLDGQPIHAVPVIRTQ